MLAGSSGRRSVAVSRAADAPAARTSPGTAGRTAPAVDPSVPSSAGSSCLAAYGTATTGEAENRRRNHFVSNLLTSFTGSPPAGDATADYSDEEMHAALDVNIAPRCLLQNQICNLVAWGGRGAGGCPGPVPWGASRATNIPG